MLTDLSQEAWDAKATEFGGSILQSWTWGEFQKALGFKIHRFSSGNYINLVTEIPTKFGKKYLYSARGPLGDVTAALTDINKLAASDHTVMYARIEPAKPTSFKKALKDTQPTNNWYVNLEKSEEQLLAEMKSKHRYNINLAQRKGVTVRMGTKEDILVLYKLLLETSVRNKFRLHPQNYYWQIFEHLFPKHLRIMVAEYNGKPLAALMLTMFGDTATYLHGGTGSLNREVMAPLLLQWEAIKFSKQQGFIHYDFGGVAPADQPNHPWKGITQFKTGFGGYEVITPGAYDIVYSPLWYNVYGNARKFSKILLRRN